MDSTNDKHLTPSRTELLEEYKETLAYMRHDDQIAWTILGLSATVSFGVWAYTFKDIPLWSRRAVALSFLGVLVFGLGRLMAYSISERTNWRRDRAKTIENKLGFELVSRQPAKRVGVNRTLTGIAVGAFALWVIYLIAFVVRLGRTL